MNEGIDQIATALSSAQAVMKPAKLNSRNPHFNSAYADLASIIEAVREPFALNGLAFVQCLDILGERPVLRTTLMHKSGQFLESVYLLPSGVKAQQFGSDLTYAKRYSLSSIAGVAADEDDDGNVAQGASKAGGVVDKALAAVAKREKGPLDD